ncbi:nuclear transport factor 2 family protein [Lonsdalea iberica]|uniref:SnoaL-like domain-containing protein n=1 Tax=Lonsdalea iberica TaxID=1082703 RepID=A0A1X3RND6_9GAMM|nr:nuclear transport factor 2 family protein [Lonsdalea iberica]OSN03254.1 hypothetical protein AU511_15340 [Lonsdalea iberica]
MNSASQIVIDALQETINNPVHSEEKIAVYFSSDYRQQVDGKHLNYDEFVKHMALLKTKTQRMTVSLLSIVAEGDTVFTHHQVNVEKSKGGNSLFEVLAHYRLSSDQIVSCQELTRMISGENGDRDLGSRR